ncbi:MAG: FapA family protein, partial [Candidatus Latescibacterota bacterium]|nr:FapA family protein [Candidatus Latescibacterota bacterium]
GIDACYVGARSGDKTVIGVDGTPADTVKANQLRVQLKEVDGKVRRLLRTLGITQIDADAMTRLIKATPPSKRASIIAFVKRLQTLLAERATVAAEHEQVQSQIDEQVKASVIEITTEIYGGTEVRFGQRSVAVTVKTPPSAYFFSDEEIHRRALN